MSEFSLSPYKIRLIDAARKQNVSFNALPQGETFCEFILTFLRQVADLDIDEKLSKGLYSENITNIESRISGLLNSGDYGYNAPIFDTKTKDQVFTREVDHIECIPFYFAFDLDPAFREGIILLQRFHQFGVKTIFEKKLNDYVKGIYPDFNVQITSIYDPDLIEEYLSHRILSLRFLKRELPTDMASYVRNRQQINQSILAESHAEFKITANNNKKLSVKDDLMSYLNGQREGVVEAVNFEFDEIKVEVKIGRSRRTISLESHKLSPIIEISDSVSIGDNGHPIYEEIDRFGQNCLNDYCERYRNIE